MDKLPERRYYASAEELDRQLAADAAAILAEAVSRKGSATLVVSGGKTPLNFFRCLSQQDLPWNRIQVTLADERWVGATDADSNEKLVRDNLLVNKASDARLVPLKTPAATAGEGEAECEARLSALGQFDLVILGMGDDGHTASLFPGADTLPLGLDRDSGRNCVAVTPPAAPHQRLSLTVPRLLAADHIFIHIFGRQKLQVLEQAMALKDAASLPIWAIINQRQAPVTLYWAE